MDGPLFHLISLAEPASNPPYHGCSTAIPVNARLSVAALRCVPLLSFPSFPFPCSSADGLQFRFQEHLVCRRRPCQTAFESTRTTIDTLREKTRETSFLR